jgi:DNA-binding Lrp family transcriptional regulator
MEKLSKHEKSMIKLLLDNGRITDREASKELNISPQACGKIRKKLEEKGIIVGYTCALNLKKVGIEAFAFLEIKFSAKFFDELKEIDVFNKITRGFGFLFCCIPSDPEISIISLLAFRNISEMDEYTRKLKLNLASYFDKLHVKTFSIGNLIQFHPNDILKLIIEGKKIEPITSLDELRNM